MSIDFCHIGDHQFDTDETGFAEYMQGCADCEEKELIAMQEAKKEI